MEWRLRDLARIGIGESYRKELEHCDWFEATIMVGHHGGATSGLILTKIRSYMESMDKIDPSKSVVFAGIPSPNFNTWALEAFNTVISFESFEWYPYLLFDNEQLVKLVKWQSEIKRPDYSDLNRILATSLWILTTSDWNLMTNINEVIPHSSF